MGLLRDFTVAAAMMGAAGVDTAMAQDSKPSPAWHTKKFEDLRPEEKEKIRQETLAQRMAWDRTTQGTLSILALSQVTPNYMFELKTFINRSPEGAEKEFFLYGLKPSLSGFAVYSNEPSKTVPKARIQNGRVSGVIMETAGYVLSGPGGLPKRGEKLPPCYRGAIFIDEPGTQTITDGKATYHKGGKVHITSVNGKIKLTAPGIMERIGVDPEELYKRITALDFDAEKTPIPFKEEDGETVKALIMDAARSQGFEFHTAPGANIYLRNIVGSKDNPLKLSFADNATLHMSNLKHATVTVYAKGRKNPEIADLQNEAILVIPLAEAKQLKLSHHHDTYQEGETETNERSVKLETKEGFTAWLGYYHITGDDTGVNATLRVVGPDGKHKDLKFMRNGRFVEPSEKKDQQRLADFIQELEAQQQTKIEQSPDARNASWTAKSSAAGSPNAGRSGK